MIDLSVPTDTYLVNFALYLLNFIICNLADQLCIFFFSSRRRHTRCSRDWSSDVCSSDLVRHGANQLFRVQGTSHMLSRANEPDHFIHQHIIVRLHTRETQSYSKCLTLNLDRKSVV